MIIFFLDCPVHFMKHMLNTIIAHYGTAISLRELDII